MKRLKFLPLLLVLLLVITSIPMKITASAETIMTEESGETEQEDVTYIIGIDYEKEPEESERYVQPEEFGDTEEEYGDVEETKPSDEASSPYESEYSATYIITEDGITVHEKTEDSETITEWNNNENATKEELINDVNKFLDNNDSREESYTPSFSTKKGNSSSSSKSESEENSDYTIVESDMVKGSYMGINWTYDPINKKLTFTPGSSTIIPWVSKDDYSSLPWMVYKDEVEKISVQDGITSIYANNFRDFTKLTKVYTSGAVNQISSYAFTGCDNIKQFVINCYKLDSSFDPDFYYNLTSNATITCNYSSESGSTYEQAISSNKIVITNQMSGGTIDNVERISQGTSRIKEVWGNEACVISSYEYLIECTAASEGYMSLSGDFSQKTGEDLILKDTNDPELMTSEKWMRWPNEKTCKSFVKKESDGSYVPLKVNLKSETENLSEEKLIKLLKDHPEGILVFQQYKSDGTSHAVVVTGYNSSSETFTVVDPGNYNNTSQTYIKLCGYTSIKTKRFYYVDQVVN